MAWAACVLKKATKCAYLCVTACMTSTAAPRDPRNVTCPHWFLSNKCEFVIAADWPMEPDQLESKAF